jgi:hypothetical protein
MASMIGLYCLMRVKVMPECGSSGNRSVELVCTRGQLLPMISTTVCRTREADFSRWLWKHAVDCVDCDPRDGEHGCIVRRGYVSPESRLAG